MAWVCALDLGIHWYSTTSSSTLTNSSKSGPKIEHIAPPNLVSIYSSFSHFPHNHATLLQNFSSFFNNFSILSVCCCCVVLLILEMWLYVLEVSRRPTCLEKNKIMVKHGCSFPFFQISPVYKRVAKNMKLQWMSRREYGWIYCVGVRSLTFVSVFLSTLFKS